VKISVVARDLTLKEVFISASTNTKSVSLIQVKKMNK